MTHAPRLPGHEPIGARLRMIRKALIEQTARLPKVDNNGRPIRIEENR